jgi:hypothetical protein
MYCDINGKMYCEINGKMYCDISGKIPSFLNNCLQESVVK